MAHHWTSEELKEYVDQIKESRDEEMNNIRASLAANTQLTAEVKKEVADLRAQTMPIVDALTTMEAGIRTIGRIGVAGGQVMKFLLFAAALWGAFKLFFSGASWSEISQAFWRSIGK